MSEQVDTRADGECGVPVHEPTHDELFTVFETAR
jgi:hypothetical protein